MGIEGGLVHPLGVNVENQRIAQRFVEMNADAAGLGARRLKEQPQLVSELLLFSGVGSKRTKVCSGKTSLPVSIICKVNGPLLQ